MIIFTSRKIIIFNLNIFLIVIILKLDLSWIQWNLFFLITLFLIRLTKIIFFILIYIFFSKIIFYFLILSLILLTLIISLLWFFFLYTTSWIIFFHKSTPFISIFLKSFTKLWNLVLHSRNWNFPYSFFN
jgi:hypothetical protein